MPWNSSDAANFHPSPLPPTNTKLLPHILHLVQTYKHVPHAPTYIHTHTVVHTITYQVSRATCPLPTLPTKSAPRHVHSTASAARFQTWAIAERGEDGKEMIRIRCDDGSPNVSVHFFSGQWLCLNPTITSHPRVRDANQQFKFSDRLRRVCALGHSYACIQSFS